MRRPLRSVWAALSRSGVYNLLSLVSSGLAELQDLFLDSATYDPTMGVPGPLVQPLFFFIMPAGGETNVPFSTHSLPPTTLVPRAGLQTSRCFDSLGRIQGCAKSIVVTAK